MNFDLSDDQQVMVDLAEQVFSDAGDVPRLKAAEQGDGWDPRLWESLVGTGLTGLCLPETHGGTGQGIVELTLLAAAQGRHLTPVPLVPTVVAAATIAEFDHNATHEALVSSVATEGTILTSALGSPGANDPLLPGVTATRVDGGWQLEGTKPAVPYAEQAAAIVVPAADTEGNSVVAVVPTGATGVRLTAERTTNHQPAAAVDLNVTVGDDAVLGTAGDPSAEVVRSLFAHTVAATCGIQLGVCEGALAATAAYVSERQQFGRPLSAFQAVTQRAADAWITTEALRVTTISAAWHLASGHDARSEVAVAAYWATEGAQKVVTAAQHLHGGIGADIDYPVHRYYLWGTQYGTQVGAASSHLARLGALIARS